MSKQVSDEQIAAVRAFNRFYTRKLGVLDQQLLKSPFSLSEARVLYELAHCDDLAAKEIGIELGLDPGYLSRIIQNFDDRGLIARKPLPSDRRQYRLSLTAKGRAAFARLDRSSHDDVADMLAALPPGDVGDPAAFARRIERVEKLCRDVGDQALERRVKTVFAGIERAVALHHPAHVAGARLAQARARRQSMGCAEQPFDRGHRAGQAGSVFLVKHSDDVAKLRLLLVDPAGRGQGLGQRLVGECIAFARACGYRKITLWTQSILLAARKIYQEAGFELAASEPHRSFGQSLIGETWEREL